MIVQGLLEMIFGLLKIVFTPINLPPLPDVIQTVVDDFTGILTGAIGLFSVFFDMRVVRVLIPVVIVLVNFQRVYNLIMYILRKIPFIGVE